ncbi:MAG: type II secretion system GspH family protein [Plectolyngbya sp. WJT66-NPBG17]|jgi:prepilin-type N-terminal cleavage/methylation domain-containing protein|nr:type II secretion system GspH family protein [Plectolyngbya sp. WJT66-NPBG17]MBW4525446.1 type II secretion system GspH family protein [Phormidium tanganyikae FI6-MK23]
MLINSHPVKRQTTAFPFAGKLALRLIQKQAISQSSHQGLTLIESLIAMVIIAITMVSITPPIFWAVATRVQTQRAEQALKIAQGEIDRVRTIIERGETADLPRDVADATINVRINVAAPNVSGTGVISTRDCGGTPGTIPPANIATFAQIDTNGDCTADYLLQTFRSQGLDQNGNPFTSATGQVLSGFVMGVRVYSSVARPELTAGRGSTQPAALRATNGLGNQLNRPLAVLYSTIVRSNESQNLELYRKLCPAASKTTGAC